MKAANVFEGLTQPESLSLNFTNVEFEYKPMTQGDNVMKKVELIDPAFAEFGK